jgi:hypothetical protein
MVFSTSSSLVAIYMRKQALDNLLQRVLDQTLVQVFVVLFMLSPFSHS